MRIELAILEITNFCNLKCKHCYGFFKEPVTMDLNKFEKVVEELYNQGCTKVVISGGEPLMIGDTIKEYVSILKRYNIPFIALTTNGTLDTVKDINIFKMFDLIQVSIDGKKETHENIRGLNTYEKSLEFIKKVQKVNSNFSIMMAVNAINYDEIEEVNLLAKELNVKFALEIVTPCGRGKDLSMITPEQMEKLKKYLIKENIDCSDPLSFCNNDLKYFNNNLITGCSAGTKALCIDSKFTVYPCVRMRIPLGNLCEKSLEEILENEIILNLNNRDKLIGKCSDCKKKYICGGCRARAYSATGNYLGGDEWCIDYEKQNK